MSQQLPPSPQLSSLRKQAKTLLRGAHAGLPEVLARFRTHLPALRSRSTGTPFATTELRLHDAHSVLAREHGFRSWTELKRTVEFQQANRAGRLKTWLLWVYQGAPRERRLAARMLAEDPTLLRADSDTAAYLACAVGDQATLRNAIAHDPAWVNRAGGPLGMPPLIAVTHSMLLLEPGFADNLLAAARLLLAHGADPDRSWIDPRYPDAPLSALYGAAGRTHHPGMLLLLLEAGANPNDNESLYHSVESRDLTCTRLLLEHGARVSGTNALPRALDFGSLETLDLLLRYAQQQRAASGSAEDQPLSDEPWIKHAILRGRPLEHIERLLAAGADPGLCDRDGLPLAQSAARHGRADVLDLLARRGTPVPDITLSDGDQFVAACARADLPAAQAVLARVPGVLTQLTPRQLQTLPELASVGNLPGVQTMLAVGWPIETRAAWDATPLHLAIYRGDAALTRLLLAYGADWRTINGFGGTAFGTLSHCSQEEPEDIAAPKDFLGCAQALVAHGAPIPDPDHTTFSPEVTDFFEGLRLAQTSP